METSQNGALRLCLTALYSLVAMGRMGWRSVTRRNLAKWCVMAAPDSALQYG